MAQNFPNEKRWLAQSNPKSFKFNPGFVKSTNFKLWLEDLPRFWIPKFKFSFELEASKSIKEMELKTTIYVSRGADRNGWYSDLPTFFFYLIPLNSMVFTDSLLLFNLYSIFCVFLEVFFFWQIGLIFVGNVDCQPSWLSRRGHHSNWILTKTIEFEMGQM